MLHSSIHFAPLLAACMQVPFAGCFLDGEVGPLLRNAWSGWAHSASGCSSAAAAVEQPLPPGVQRLDHSCLQSYTSVFAALGEA
jgi:hypothetical protein